MSRSLILILISIPGVASLQADEAAIERGQRTFATYCAPCHGAEGAGMIGPNLTDAEVLHGEKLADIITVITAGVPAKSMPSWAAVLTAAEIRATAEFVGSIMGKNLQGPDRGGESSVTPFPEGTPTWPYLIRTFMPSLDIGPEVFAHHDEGRSTFKYNATEGIYDMEIEQQPIDGVPGAIAVNFGPLFSYCFDTTECRLLYTWSGPFLDMTSYWGEGTGGARKSFDYLARVLGEVTFKAMGAAPIAGTPHFKGYRKVKGIPEMIYSIGEIDFTLRIEPTPEADFVRLHYTTTGSKEGVVFSFDPDDAIRFDCNRGIFNDSQLILSPAEAAEFTLEIAL